MGPFIEKRIKQRQDPRGLEQLNLDILLSQFPSADYVIAQGQGDFGRASVQSPQPQALNESQFHQYAQEILTEMQAIEQAARNPLKWDTEPSIANNIKLVVVFSAPGTYFLMEKPDRHHQQPQHTLS